MEQQLLSLFESAKKSADAVATSASISCPEVYRCLDALDQLKRVPVTSGVLLSTPVANGLHFLTKHRVKLIRTAASCLIDTWRRKLYARNPAIYGPTKSVNGSRTGTLVIKLRGRVIGRIRVKMPMKAVKTEEKKIKEEKEKGFSSLKKQPQEPAMRFTEPVKGKGTIRWCFKKPPQESAKCNKMQEKAIDSCSSFKKPCTKRITPQKNVKDFCSFKKPSDQGPVKCSDAFRCKVRDILVESLSRVVKEAGAGLWKAVNSCDPIRVAAEVESVMLEKMGPFNGSKTMNYRSILFNLKDPKNPDFRRKVLLGQIKPEKVVTMTSEEMASNQRQSENEQIRMKLSKKMKNAEQEYKSVDPLEY